MNKCHMRVCAVFLKKNVLMQLYLNVNKSKCINLNFGIFEKLISNSILVR